MPRPKSKSSNCNNGPHNRKTDHNRTWSRQAQEERQNTIIGRQTKKKDRPQILRGQSGTVASAGWRAIPINDKHTKAPTHNQNNKEEGKKRHPPEERWLLIFPFGVTQMNTEIRPKQPAKFPTFWHEFRQRCADNDVVLSLPQNESQS